MNMKKLIVEQGSLTLDNEKWSLEHILLELTPKKVNEETHQKCL